MTEKMDMTLRHIETAVDVDDWAKIKCRQVFEAWDKVISDIQKETMPHNQGIMLSVQTIINDRLKEIDNERTD